MNELCKSCNHRFQCLTGESRDWDDCLIHAQQESSSLRNYGRENAHIPVIFLKERAKARKEERDLKTKKRINESLITIGR